MTTIAKMQQFLATNRPFATLTQDFFNHNSTFSSLSGISDDEKSGLLVKMHSVGFTPEQCDLAAKAMQTTDQVALTFFSHDTVATTAALVAEEVADAADAADAKAVSDAAKQVESDAKMAKKMQEDESKSGGGGAAAEQSALTSAWDKSGGGMSASKTKIMFDRMQESAKANQAKRKSKKTPAKTLKDELKAVTSKIFALCEENKIAGLSKERQSRIDELKEKQEKLNKQIAATQVPCGRGECSNFVGYNHHGVLYTFCCHRCECMNTHGVTPGRLARINRTPPVTKTFHSVQKKHTTRAGLPRGKLLRDMKH